MTNLTYPLEEEAFIAYQQDGMGRESNDNEIYLLGLATNYINGAFELGQTGGVLFPASMVDIEEIFSRMGEAERLKDSVFQRFFMALLIWLNEAYQAGQTECGGGGDDDSDHLPARENMGGGTNPTVCQEVVAGSEDQTVWR